MAVLPLTSTPPQPHPSSTNSAAFTHEAIISLAFGLCMAVTAVVSLWLAWVQYLYQRRMSQGTSTPVELDKFEWVISAKARRE
ncbi:hypothetical protein N7G274_000043 [Stereocaulon virgatum]|uniref:Uncharacterized protein n=1 Tax=Stereocaulon virgatum TaxID=373712 RepID=A0ABR3ZU76_9LECA